MKILFISDEECPALWDFYVPGRLDGIDLIISCGDLKSTYLQFLVTVARCPLLFIPGNHDASYEHQPPEGCDCIDDAIVEYNGVRIMGLGGCRRYHPGRYQYTEKQMRRRHPQSPFPSVALQGSGHCGDPCGSCRFGGCRRPGSPGLCALRELLDKYHPQYLVHGHVHLCYDNTLERVRDYNGTTLINAYERYVLEIPEREVSPKHRNQLRWKSKHTVMDSEWDKILGMNALHR